MKIRIISTTSRNASKWHAFGGPMGNVFKGDGEYPNFLGIKQQRLSPPQIIGYLPEAGVIDWSNPFAANQAILDAKGNSPQAPTELFPNGIIPTTNKNNNNNNTSEIPEYQQKPWITAMRAIPVVGSSLQAMSDAFGWTNEEDYDNPTIIRKAADRIRNVRTSPIGRYMSYNPYDVDYEMNRIQNVGLGTQRGLLDTAGGNALAARNAMVALNNNITSQMGDARRSASQINEQRRQAVQQFNSNIDQFNAQQALNASIYNQRADEAKLDAAVREAMLRDNIQSTLSGARSSNYTAALNNAGQFGNDRMFADMAAWYQKYVAPFNKATQTYGASTAAKGGKIKKFEPKPSFKSFVGAIYDTLRDIVGQNDSSSIQKFNNYSYNKLLNETINEGTKEAFQDKDKKNRRRPYELRPYEFKKISK